MPETRNAVGRLGTPLGTTSGYACDESRPLVPERWGGYVRTTPLPPLWPLASIYACVRSSMTQNWLVRQDLLAQGLGPRTEQLDLLAQGLGPRPEEQTKATHLVQC